MSLLPPPLRFLAAVVGGWALVRAVLLAPGAWIDAGQAAEPATARKVAATRAAATWPLPGQERPRPIAIAAAASRHSAALPRQPLRLRLRGAQPSAPVVEVPPEPDLVAASAAQPSLLPLPPLPRSHSVPRERRPGRWAGSAWMLVRQEQAGSTLAPGGTLGGSQAGLRLLYRINDDAERPIALSGRFYAPLRQSGAAEAAFGLDWQPLARLPLHLLAERRQAFGGNGRSAFGLTLYGGHGGRVAGPVRFDAYAQAGVVGLRSRDLFVDGSARLWAPVGRRIELGGALWGAAQPGVERLDAGPQLSYRLPVGRTNLRLTADWRFRLAGDAEPGSGPALTLSTDF